MSDSDWRRYGALGAVIFAIVLAIGIAYSVYYELKQSQQRQAVAPQHPYTANEHQRDACGAIPGLTEYRRCLAEQAKAEREEEREQHDLQAQQDMALWTFILMWAGGIGLAATVVGVGLVALTFKATRDTLTETEDANKEARNRTRKELRAYLSAEPAGINRLLGNRNVMGHVELRNVGKLPAKDVIVSVRMAIASRHATPAITETGRGSNRVIQPGATMRQGSTNFLSLTEVLKNKKLYLFVWGIASYHDGYSGGAFTRFCHRYPIASHERGHRLALPARKRESLIMPEQARYHETGNEAE